LPSGASGNLQATEVLEAGLRFPEAEFPKAFLIIIFEPLSFKLLFGEWYTVPVKSVP